MHWLIDRTHALPLIAARARAVSAGHARSAALFEGDFFDRAFSNRRSMALARARETGVLEVPVSGVLASADMAGWYWYADTPVESIREDIAEGLAEPRVQAILLRVLSPGGVVDGTWSLATFIAGHTQRRGGDKPIWAFVERANSAAYWIASQADRVIGTATADVGSIGVITEHIDVSRMLEEMGIAVTPIFSGAAKADFHDARPLSEEARSRVQAELDTIRHVFAASVATARGLAEDAVIGTEAQTFIGAEAMRAGLIDGVDTIDATRAALLRAAGSRQTPAAPRAAAARRPKPVQSRSRRQPGQTAQSKRSKTMARYRLAGCRTAAGNPTAGEALAAELNRLIDNQVTEERTRDDVIAEMASAAGIDESTVNQILRGEINCPPVERLEGFASVLDVAVSDLVSAAEEDGCVFEEEEDDSGGDQAAAAPPPASAKTPVDRTARAADPSARILAILDLPEAKGREDLAKELARAGLTPAQAKAALGKAPKRTAAAGEAFLASMTAEPSPQVGPDDGENTTADAGAAVAATCRKAGLGHLFRDA